MRLVAVSVGRPRGVPFRGRLIQTGIFKEPVAAAVMLRELGADGDGQADLSVHGGRDKAVYAYPHEHYSYWQAELDRDDFSFGQFGENLTTVGVVESEVAVGDVFRIGEAKLEISQPRIPCLKLGIRMGQADFPKRFATSGRSGFYVRVLEEGQVSAGDEIECIHHEQNAPPLSELLAAYYRPADHRATLERAIQQPALSQAWRNDLTERLIQLRETRE